MYIPCSIHETQQVSAERVERGRERGMEREREREREREERGREGERVIVREKEK
jgi:hypothetical protein